MLSGWDLFKIHHSLKLHFTTPSYDVLKYNGKSRISQKSFEVRNDKLRFDSFANKLIGKNKAGHFCIANFVYGNPNFMYGTYEDAYDVYLEWKKVREMVTRTVEKDVNYINQLKSGRAGQNFFAKTNSGNYPPLMQVALGGKISVETLCILDKEHKEFFDSWAAICQNDPYMSKQILKWKKYQPFVSYDADKIKPILNGAKF